MQSDRRRGQEQILLGHPLDPAAQMGALIEQGHMERVLGYIGIGRAEARAHRLRRIPGHAGDRRLCVEATILDDVELGARVAREETLGLWRLSRPSTPSRRRRRRPTTPSTASPRRVWTRDMNAVHPPHRAIRAGTVWVNCFDRSSPATPFGGFKQSGFGRDRSPHAIEKYMDFKTVWTAYT